MVKGELCAMERAQQNDSEEYTSETGSLNETEALQTTSFGQIENQLLRRWCVALRTRVERANGL